MYQLPSPMQLYFNLSTAVLSSKPKLSDLQKYIRPSVASRWEELGIALGLSDDDDGEALDRIQRDRNGDNNLCFNEAMKLWLRSGAVSGPLACTWSKLFDAIKSIQGFEDSGAQIQTQLLAASK